MQAMKQRMQCNVWSGEVSALSARLALRESSRKQSEMIDVGLGSILERLVI